MTATNFRKDLFATLDRVLEGELVEIHYKGATVKLTARPPATPKLARAKRQNTILGDLSLDPKMKTAWEADWNEL